MAKNFVEQWFYRGAIVVLVVATAVWPAVTMNGLFTNNMVLQHGMSVPVWGTATSGENVSVTINGQTKTGTASTAGSWKIILDSLSIGGPFQMVVRGANTITLTNVMVGEVWLCSGQSNMTIGLGAFYNAGTEAVGLTNVRLFSEVSDISGVGPWNECTPSTASNFSATAFFFGKYLYDSLKIPIGLIVSAVGATFIEQWMPTQAIIDDPFLDTSTIMTGGNAGVIPNGLKAGGLYRGAIVPLQPFALRGTIWYQGEWNTGGLGNSDKYQTRFTELINGWRADWGQGEYPFYFVQLPNYKSADAWATIREAQRLTRKNVANTGMAIAIDIGNVPGFPDSTELHPRNKKDVGYRLALLALVHTYGHNNIVPSGPLFKNLYIRNDTAHLLFDYIGSGLIAKNGVLSGFQIAAANDTNYVAASATIASREVIAYKPGSKVTRVRYAWASNPAATLYNNEGLPASPFQTYITDITAIERKRVSNANDVVKKRTIKEVMLFDLAGHCVMNIPGNKCPEVMAQRMDINSLLRLGRFSKGVYIAQCRLGDNTVIKRKIVRQ
jgi:sialate O-acetylesterase